MADNARKPLLIDVNAGNLGELPCCGITDPKHPGRQAKLRWLVDNFKIGARAKILVDPDHGPCGYIEYLPGEHAWRGVDAAGYMFIHCIWNHVKASQRKGWAGALIETCVKDARKAGMNGVAVVAREGPWLTDQRLFLANGFRVADTAAPDYHLLVLKFKKRAADPAFKSGLDERLARYGKGLTIIRAGQCPYAVKFGVEIAESAKLDFGITPKLVTLRTARDAQSAPTPYAVFSVIYKGRVVADHQISRTRFRNIMRAEGLRASARTGAFSRARP